MHKQIEHDSFEDVFYSQGNTAELVNGWAEVFIFTLGDMKRGCRNN